MLEQLRELWDELILGGETFFSLRAAERRAFHEQHVHILGRVSDQTFHQLALASVDSEIAAVEQPFTSGLDHHRVTVIR